MAGFVRKAGEGDARWFYGNPVRDQDRGLRYRRAVRADRLHLPAGFEPGTHTHQDEDEAFYVLEGTLHGQCGTAGWTASAGDLVFVPRDTPHNFTVIGPAPARYLVINSPPEFARQVAQHPRPKA